MGVLGSRRPSSRRHGSPPGHQQPHFTDSDTYKMAPFGRQVFTFNLETNTSISFALNFYIHDQRPRVLNTFPPATPCPPAGGVPGRPDGAPPAPAPRHGAPRRPPAVRGAARPARRLRAHLLRLPDQGHHQDGQPHPRRRQQQGPTQPSSPSLQVVTFEEHFEICSLVGTLSAGGHLHIVLGRADGSTLAGHVVGISRFADRQTLSTMKTNKQTNSL